MVAVVAGNVVVVVVGPVVVVVVGTVVAVVVGPVVAVAVGRIIAPANVVGVAALGDVVVVVDSLGTITVRSSERLWTRLRAAW